MTARRRFDRKHVFHPSDRFLVSYPKSGNTWARFLLASLLLEGNEASFGDIDRLIPDIYISNDKILNNAPRPRLLKSHHPYVPNYRRVVYISRDPRDIACSYYHHCLRKGWVGKDTGIDEFVDLFLHGNVDAYGPWGEHVGSWLGAREGDDDFLFIKYEQLMRQPEEELGRMARHLNIPSSESMLSKAVQESAFDRLQAKERASSDTWQMARGADPRYPFFRSGRAQGWREELPQKCADRIRDAWPGVMDRLGYVA